jgi:hypothetical protein
MNAIDEATARPWKLDSGGFRLTASASKDWMRKDGYLAEVARFSIGSDRFAGGVEERNANIAFAVKAVNEYDALCAVAEAAKGLMDALAVADKQWIGLNMLNPGQKRAYEIIQAAKIKMEAALHEKESK